MVRCGVTGFKLNTSLSQSSKPVLEIEVRIIATKSSFPVTIQASGVQSDVGVKDLRISYAESGI